MKRKGSTRILAAVTAAFVVMSTTAPMSIYAADLNELVDSAEIDVTEEVIEDHEGHDHDHDHDHDHEDHDHVEEAVEETEEVFVAEPESVHDEDSETIEEEIEESGEYTVTNLDDDLGLTQEELFAGYVDQTYDIEEEDVLVGAAYGEEFFKDSPADLGLYRGVVNQFKNIAENGGKTKTTIRFRVSAEEYTKPNLTNIVRVAMADCPYEAYWFDKTEGYSYVPIVHDLGTEYSINYSLTFKVIEAYQDGSNTVVTTDVKSVKESAANALAIVNKYKNLSDYDKLTAYKDEICDLVTYDYDAVFTTTAWYGDPWQMIYVFDKNEKTNVVCEGYSKAFQYLCDKSEFKNTTCYTVTGYMNGGGHMWNLVAMNNANYFVDVTNTDDDDKLREGLFMITGIGDGKGYEICPKGWSFPITYKYKDETLALYSDKILDMTYNYGSSSGNTDTGNATHTHTVVTDKAVAATCTTTGLTAGSHCSTCGEVIVAQKTVAAKGHTAVTDKAVAATCTTTGLTAGSHCSTCGTVITAQKTVAAKGHTAVTDKAVAATCTTTGLTAGSHCSTCGTVITAQKTVAAKGHTLVSDKAKAATCTTAGYTDNSVCSVCGYEAKGRTVIPAKGHTVVIDKAVAATCTKTGLTEGSHCSTCGEVITAQKTVAAKGHTVVTDKAKSATCTTTGLTAGSHCSTCGTVITAQKTVAAKGHTWSSWKQTTAPTTTAEGKETRSCTSCNATETRKVAKLQSAEKEEAIPVYRLYNRKTGEHLYTTSANEKNVLAAMAAWDYEGVAWKAYAAESTTGNAIHRLYNPKSGEHHYSGSANEIKVLTTQYGWRDEGAKWRSPSSGTPVYRLYNKKAAAVASHHLTTSANERDVLSANGWKYEGIAWYGIS